MIEKFIKNKIIAIIGLPLIIILFLIFIIMAITGTVFNDPKIMVSSIFNLPFPESIDYTITSNYGKRIDPITGLEAIHNAIDVASIDGTEIHASYDGMVIESDYQEDGLGQYVVIEHKIENVIYYTIYGHMILDSVVVNVGQPVISHQKIGIMGSTGKSTGTHLHFEIHINKRELNGKNTINPILIFQKEKKTILS